MMRYCVIGNSHTAALKTGWDRIAAAHPGVRVTFFAAQGTTFSELELRQRSLHAVSSPVRRSMALTSDGLEHIALDDYDAFVLCGLGLGIVQVLRVYATHCCLSLNGWVDGTLVSRPCFDQAVAGLVHNSLTVQLARKIRSGTAAPIVAVSTPMPTMAVLDDPQGQSRLWRRAADHQDEAALAEIFRRVVPAQCAPCDAVLLPPEATLQTPLTTQTAYSQGSVRLMAGFSKVHGQHDFEHMNAQYGEQVWQDLFSLGLQPAAVSRPERASARRPPALPPAALPERRRPRPEGRSPSPEPAVRRPARAPAERPGNGAAGFVVYTLPRSGSYHLVSLLNSAGDVLCHGEVFKSGVIEAERDVLERMDIDRADVEARDRDRVAFVHRLRSKCRGQIFGFKFFPEHVRGDPEFSRRILNNPNWRKVFLFRNPVQIYASLLRARQNGVWVLNKGARRDSSELNAPVTFSPDSFERSLKLCERLELLCRRCEQAGADSVFRLDYAELSDSARLTALLRFLGSAGLSQSLVSSRERQYSAPFEEGFTNWPALVDHLRERGLLHWLEFVPSMQRARSGEAVGA